MGDKFDPYREALVMEIETLWPEQCRDWTRPERERFERRLHATAADVSELHYIRTHTGFCRRIVVNDADIARLAEAQADAAGGQLSQT